jgi:hypothetical protein
MPLKQVQERDEEVDMKFEYRKKSLILPEEAHFSPLSSNWNLSVNTK